LKRQELERGFCERPPTSSQFFREGRAGQWREVLTPKQIAAVCMAHAPVMRRHGYLAQDCDLSSPPPRVEEVGSQGLVGKP
jgi:hypothetical protein